MIVGRSVDRWKRVFCGLWIGALIFIPQARAVSDTGERYRSEHGVPGAEHSASHDGAMVGLEYDDREVAHLEIRLDADSGELRVYLTDAEAVNPVRIPQETIEAAVNLPGHDKVIVLELSAVDDRRTGETAGDASVFSVRSDALIGVDRFGISISSIFMQGYEMNDIRFTYPEGNH